MIQPEFDRNRTIVKNYKQNRLRYFISQLVPASAVVLLAAISLVLFYFHPSGHSRQANDLNN
jgi:hypothetical protein